MTIPYEELVPAIKSAAKRVNLTYSADGDGRITSAVKEKEYLDALEGYLKESHPSVVIERPPDRFWYDIRIGGIPINLKLTTGGTDNAFNKVAICYTLVGHAPDKRNMNFNQWYALLRESVRKETRDQATEYHYLAVDKATGNILFKSIMDIHTYKTNPCNDLQINWRHEFNCIDHITPVEAYGAKVRELLKAIQSSIRQAIASMQAFASADIDTDFP